MFGKSIFCRKIHVFFFVVIEQVYALAVKFQGVLRFKDVIEEIALR